MLMVFLMEISVGVVSNFVPNTLLHVLGSNRNNILIWVPIIARS